MGDLILVAVAVVALVLWLDSRHDHSKPPTPEQERFAEDIAIRQYEPRYDPPDWL